jgi:hypothetical protein
MIMTKIEVENAIVSLAVKDYQEFRPWFLERDWQRWDREIEEDAQTGKLGFLIREAQEAKRAGKLGRL